MKIGLTFAEVIVKTKVPIYFLRHMCTC